MPTSPKKNPHKNLLGYAIEDRLQPSFKPAGWALPKILKERMLMNMSSWKRRYYGLYLEALSKSDDKLWQPLGHILSTEPPRGCVWYCPSVLIGEGAFAKVYLGVDNLGRPVAVKMFYDAACAVIADRGGIDGDFSEAHKLASQSETHGGLVKYITHVHWEVPDSNNPMAQVDRYALVTELMNCSLQTLIKKWKEVKCTTEELAEVVPGIALQLISTIRDFHTVPDSNGDVMLHNDLNLKNIMIDCRGNVRVIDVGISRRIADSAQFRDHTLTSRVAKDMFRAPEIRDALDLAANGETPQHLPWDFKTDVYSLGLVLGQLGQVTDTPTTHFQCCLADIVRRCTQESPSERPTCDELLSHPLMWSAEECVTFLAQFVNPFLPTNNQNLPFKMINLSEHFIGSRANFIDDRSYSNWTDVMDKTTNSDLKTFWSVVSAPTKLDVSKYGTQFQLLRMINNYVSYHHEPFVPEVALLEAFPHLVVDAYNVALSGQEFGIGIRSFLKPKRSPNAAKIQTRIPSQNA
jgi:serine/threonine protein kinase